MRRYCRRSQHLVYRINVVRQSIEGKLTVEGRGEPATPLRGSNFGDICRARGDHEGDTKAGNEPTDDELVGMSGSGDDCSPDANDQATHEHANTATEAIPGRG